MYHRFCGIVNLSLSLSSLRSEEPTTKEEKELVEETNDRHNCIVFIVVRGGR